MKIILILLSLLFLSCGTETGNPIDSANGENQVGYPSDDLEPDDATFQILRQVCTKLNECFGIVSYDCEVDIFTNIDGFDSRFALNVTNYSTYRDIYLAESNNLITVSTSNLATCISDITALACGSINVTSSYSLASPNNYSNSSNIIPVGANSCQDTFIP